MEKLKYNASSFLASIVWKIVWVLVVIATVCICGCEARKHNRDMDISDSRPDNMDVSVRTQELLTELNDLERKHGNRIRKSPDYDVPGEVIAKMDIIKEELEELGYMLVWSNEAYVLRKP